MNFKFLVIALFCCTGIWAQNATLKGTLTDQDTQDGLPFATISIKGTSIGANSDLDGKFELHVPAGNHTVVFEFLGYDSKEVAVSIKQGETKTQQITLASNSYELEGVVVQATRSRSKEAALLVDQQRSLEIKQNIGSQELSRKGVSDVAAAVIKTTGVSKQESSGTVFVRGLGDRYNTTSLNGLPIPSNDPENKNISLDIFSTDIVEYISIDKTYSSRNYGDFAGGNVDIISKKHAGAGYFNFSIGSSINANAVQQDDFRLLSDRSFLGFSDTKIPENPLKNYAFTNSTQNKNRGPYGFNFGFNTGKSFHIGQEGQLNLFATASFENGFNYKEGVARTAQAQGSFEKDLAFESFHYSTNTTGMFNADYSINSNNNIKYNFLFINDSSEKNEEYTGYMRDKAEGNDTGFLRRQTYKENTLMVQQLLGKHQFNDQFVLNWGASYNTVTGDTPDRMQFTTRTSNLDQYYFVTNSTSDNHRYFDHLTENEIAANVSLDYNFAKNEEGLFDGKFIVGYNGRKKTRDFEATQFNLNINRDLRRNPVDPNNMDLFFNAANFNQGYFDIETFRGGKNTAGALDPQTYSGDMIIHGGFATLEYRLTPKLSTVLGLRLEQLSQEVTWRTQLDDEEKTDDFDKTAFLPNLSLKYELNDRNNLRLAASKTYTLPQFKERARFIYEDVTTVKVGNPDLYPSDDYNLDLKWEFFPQNDEIFSVTAFGKYIQNPINEIVMASSSNDITFANTGDYGYAAGVEIEVRKNIISFDEVNTNKISGGLNAAYMKTHQKLDNDKVAAETNIRTLFTHDTASFTGASDFLLNADLTYAKEWQDRSIMATLSYAHFSDKLNSIGTEKSGNLVDKSFGMLDFVFKTKFTENFGMGISAKNLLDPKIETVQENLNKDVLVNSYKLGRNFSLSFNYTF